MKTQLFSLILFLSCFCFGSIQAQSTFNFQFQVLVNGTSYGTWSESTTHYGTLTGGTPLPTLCPGDEITLRNLCSYSGSTHDFDGSGTFSTPTVGLVNQMGCSNPNPPANYIPVQHLGDVCPGGGCYASTLSTYQEWNSWNYNSSVTVEIPYLSTPNQYLVVSAYMFSNVIGNCGCGNRWAYLPLNFGDTPDLIDNQQICEGDLVDLDLPSSGHTYNNWNPSNPDGTVVNTTTNYTVDITKAGGCTITDQFTVHVNSPTTELINVTELCYNESIMLNDNSVTSETSTITINGNVVYDLFNGPYTFMQIIDGPTMGAGTVTIVYEYLINGTETCTKTYQIVIHPQIASNLLGNYDFCNNNFGSICANTSAQIGVSYIWSYGSYTNVVGTGFCFTPTAYGTYHLTATDVHGCQIRRTFTVNDPGVGINSPRNIRFCSMTQRPPRHIGWFSDPFGPILYSFSWTYTPSGGGSTVSIINTGAQYQVPYIGTGTYTVVVNANGCTETFTITVTDLLQIYNNSSQASFGIVPSGGMAHCTPVNPLSGVVDVWTVVDEFGTSISTSVSSGTMSFTYTTSVEYTITLIRYDSRNCAIYNNTYEWTDHSRKGSSRRLNVSGDLEITSPTQIEAFPNPTTGLVNIKMEHATGNSTVEVLNTLGQVILQKTFTQQDLLEFDLSEQVDGIYLIRVVNGETEKTLKIIKQ